VIAAGTSARVRVAGAGGLLVAATGLGLFFLALGLRDWYWPPFGVPGGTGFSFLDLRFFTSAWDCVRDGVDVTPANPCDALDRPFIYPSVWTAPAPLGLGEEHTVPLGAVLAVGFVASAFAALGRVGVGDGLVWAAALCSPAVMLGVERGNPDLVIFCLVVWGVLLLQAESVPARLAAHGLLLLAAVLKLYPVLAWGPLLLQRRRWAIAGTGTLTAAFAVYAFATRDDIRRIRENVPQDDRFAYGAAILGDEVGGALVVLAAAAGLALLLLRLARRRGVRAVVPATPGERRDRDLFVAGAATFVGTFALGHNYNYRMVFLLLTLPQLLRWSRTRLPARLAATAVLATLWLGTSIAFFPLGIGEWWERVTASFPYDELANVGLAGLLGAALGLFAPRVVPALSLPGTRRPPGCRAGADPADRSRPG
jgi:hypothetical protein